MNGVDNMTKILMTLIICATVIILAVIGNKKK